MTATSPTPKPFLASYESARLSKRAGKASLRTQCFLYHAFTRRQSQKKSQMNSPSTARGHSSVQRELLLLANGRANVQVACTSTKHNSRSCWSTLVNLNHELTIHLEAMPVSSTLNAHEFQSSKIETLRLFAENKDGDFGKLEAPGGHTG